MDDEHIDFTDIDLEADLVIKYDKTNNKYILYTPLPSEFTFAILAMLIERMGCEVEIVKAEEINENNDICS